jgi:hypothetical protein
MDRGDNGHVYTDDRPPEDSGLRREDVDDFIQASFTNPNDIEAEVISRPVKSTGHLFSWDN